MAEPEFQLCRLNPLATKAILDYQKDAAAKGRRLTANEAACEWVDLKYDKWVRKQLRKMGYPRSESRESK